MIKCPNCQHENPINKFKCEECGFALWEDIPGPASDTTVIQKLPENFPKGSIKSGWGTSTFAKTNFVILHIKDASEPIMVRPTDEYLLGRFDAENGLNLSEYKALTKGVSRTHAAFRRGDDMLFLVDLGSTNGTFLNEQQLTPNQPRLLRSGDQFDWGSLSCTSTSAGAILQ